MKRIHALSSFLLLACLAALPAAAASSGWTQTPGGDVRLVALPRAGDGTMRAILDIRLHEGWKTYWRDPGGSGIPPSVTVSGATLGSVGFPPPKLLGEEGQHYVGYDRPVALPLTLSEAEGQVTASVFLGVCKDICIPVQAELTVDTRGEAFTNPLEEAAVAAAEADLPAGASDDFKPLSGRFSKDGKTLKVRFLAPANGAVPDVFVSGPSSFQFAPAGSVERDGEAFLAEVPVLYTPKRYDLAADPLRLTVRAGGRAMESPLVID